MKKINRETNMYDLLIHILQRWRFIILCLIIGMLVLGAYGIKNQSAGSSQSASQGVSEVDGVAAGKKLSDSRRNCVEITAETIKRYYKLIDKQKEYNENALYMKLDPYNLGTGEIRYYIDNYQEVEWNHELNALVQAYSLVIKSEEMYQAMGDYLADRYNIDSYHYYYFRDLISINTDSIADGIFIVVAYGNDYNETEELLNIVKDVIKIKSNDIKKEFGEHTISLIGENIFTNMNTSVRDIQTNYKQTILDFYAKINTLKSSITDATEKTYLEYLLSVNDEEETEEPEVIGQTSGLTIKKAGFSINGKFAGIGAILGIIVAVILIIIKYVAVSTIKTYDELEKYLNIQVLARMDGESGFSRKHRTAFDKWLHRKKLKNRHKLKYEENIELIAAKIEIAAEKNNLKTICIATDIECDDKLINDIISKLDGKIELMGIRNFLAKADALQSLSHTDGVVLIEQTEESRYQNIVEEIQLCSKYELNIIGAIVLE